MSGVTDNYGLVLPDDYEAYDVAIPNSNNVQVDLQLKLRDKKADGRIYNTPSVSNSGAVGATLSVVNNIPTFTFKAGREYSIIWDFEFYGDTTNAYFEFTIATCAVADGAALITGLTDKIKRIRSVQQGGGSFYDSARVEAPITYGADTTVQIKFLAQLVANAGNVVVVGSAVHPALYIIEDKGDN